MKLNIPISRNKITVGCSNDLKLRKSDKHLKEEMDLSFYLHNTYMYLSKSLTVKLND